MAPAIALALAALLLSIAPQLAACAEAPNNATTTTAAPSPSFDAFLGLLTASGQHVADDYARVFNYSHNLAPPYAANGVAYTGAGLRLRRVVAKLLRGEPTKIVVIGGSISWRVRLGWVGGAPLGCPIEIAPRSCYVSDSGPRSP